MLGYPPPTDAAVAGTLDRSRRIWQEGTGGGGLREQNLRRILILVAAVTSGCAVVDTEPPPPMPTITGEQKDPSEAWARLPETAGDVKSVVETTGIGSRRQRIVLAGAESLPGENAISVAIGPVMPPTSAALVEEMRVALPGTPMRFALNPELNAAGTFAYAVGDAGPFTCVYAWQSTQPATEIRIRLCRNAPADETVTLLRALALDLPEPAAG